MHLDQLVNNIKYHNNRMREISSLKYARIYLRGSLQTGNEFYSLMHGLSRSQINSCILMVLGLCMMDSNHFKEITLCSY